MKRSISLLFLLVSINMSFAQQDPQYTQYMYNMSVINPAYAGSKDAISMGLLYRNQWVNIEDSPSTATLFAHTSVGNNVGLGFSVISDRIGPVEETNAYGDFSYTLKFGDKQEVNKLAFGIKAGFTIHNVGLFDDINFTLIDPGDIAFSQNSNNTFFNFGAGIFYYTSNYYLGFSMPNILNAVHLDINGRQIGTEVEHFFFTGGYVMDMSDKVKFKPSFMLKTALSAPTSLDLSANVYYNEMIEGGLTYRTGDSFGAMVNFNITSNLRIGYAYDYITSDLNIATNSSHEIILLYDLSKGCKCF